MAVYKFKDRIISKFVSINEDIITFADGKKNLVGLKNFSGQIYLKLCNILYFYQDKDSFQLQNVIISFIVGEPAILNVYETFSFRTRSYFDRYFTTVNLVENLHLKKIRATGKIMKNRIPK